MEKTAFNKDFILICITGFLLGFGTSMAETLVSSYAKTLGGLPSQIGLISSICSVSALLVLPLSAPLLDAYRKNITFSAACILQAAAYAGFAFSGSIEALLLLRLVNGVGKGLSNTLCIAIASDALPEENKTEGVVWCSLAMAVSVAFAPSAGLYVSAHFGYAVNFFCGAVFVLAAVCCSFLLNLPAGSGKIRISLQGMIAAESLKPAFLMVCMASAYSTINSFLVVYAGELGIEGIGLYFTVYSFALLISRPFATRMTKKYREILVLLPAMICFALSMGMVAVSRTLIMFTGAALISAFGYGICQPLVQSMCIRCAGEGRSGVGSSTSFIGTNTGYLIGPCAGGLLAEKFGYSAMYMIMILPVAAGAVMIYIMLLKEKNVSCQN